MKNPAAVALGPNSKIVLLQHPKTGKWFWAKAKLVVKNDERNFEIWTYDPHFTESELAAIPFGPQIPEKP